MAIQYYMRAYNTATLQYVEWVVNDQPDSTGVFAPGGSANLTNIVVNRSVQSKVQNFLKPTVSPSFISGAYNNPQDGYLFHLNSYDWLHPVVTGGSGPITIPDANQPIGISVVRGSASSSSPFTPSNYASMYWEEGLQEWVFGFINSNGSIGTPLSVAMGNLVVNGASIVDGYEVINGFLVVTNVSNNPADTSVSQTGLIRLPNSQSITARNSVNNGDIIVVSTDGYTGSNNVILGDPNHNVMIGGTAANTIGNPAPNTTTIAGNLLVLGNSTIVESTIIDIVGRVIHANWSTNLNVPPPTQLAGYTVHRGAGATNQNDGAAIIWTEGAQIITGTDGYWKFTSLTQDIDTVSPASLANLLNVMGASFSVASSPNPVSGSLASSGAFRTQNAVVAVASRNASGTGNLFLVGTDGYDRITHGGTLNAGYIFNTSPTGLYDLQVNSVSEVQLGGDVNGPFVREGITFNPALSGFIRVPSNTIAVAARNAANAADLILLATDGYNHILHGAAGINAGHIFNATTGSVFDFQINGNSQVQIAADNIIFTDGYATISQAPTYAASATGATFTVAAQSALGALGIGGNLNLTSGIGALVDGYINLQVGGHGVAAVEANQVAGSGTFTLLQGFRRNVATFMADGYDGYLTQAEDYVAITQLLAPTTLHMPSFPVVGDAYEIKDTTGNALTSNVTISGNGYFIDGSSNYVINTAYGKVNLVFTGSSWSVS